MRHGALPFLKRYEKPLDLPGCDLVDFPITEDRQNARQAGIVLRPRTMMALGPVDEVLRVGLETHAGLLSFPRFLGLLSGSPNVDCRTPAGSRQRSVAPLVI